MAGKSRWDDTSSSEALTRQQERFEETPLRCARDRPAQCDVRLKARSTSKGDHQRLYWRAHDDGEVGIARRPKRRIVRAGGDDIDLVTREGHERPLAPQLPPDETTHISRYRPRITRVALDDNFVGSQLREHKRTVAQVGTEWAKHRCAHQVGKVRRRPVQPKSDVGVSQVHVTKTRR